MFTVGARRRAWIFFISIVFLSPCFLGGSSIQTGIPAQRVVKPKTTNTPKNL